MEQEQGIREVPVWRPIEFSECWRDASTAKLDKLLPSWRGRREQLEKQGDEYEKFIGRLKRQHAIETGVIERLYDLNEGITETFIKEGFVDSYIQHGDTDVPPSVLMQFLRSHFDAMDFVFDVVKNSRPMSKGFILELHQLVTSHQDTTEAIDPSGNRIEIALLKGQFKKHDNNPRRMDGTTFMYCPPIHVESEVQRLVTLYNESESRAMVHPVVLAAWFHHAFVQIHPFQDGNGRMARLLGSLILIRHNLFPLNVERSEKTRYIDSLEKADRDEFQPLIDLFCDIQVRNIEFALNWKTEQVPSSYAQVVESLVQKLNDNKSREQEQREALLAARRRQVFDVINEQLKGMVRDLQHNVKGLADVHLNHGYPGEERDHYYAGQIIEYARQHHYYFNRALPKGWFTLQIHVSKDQIYRLVISGHHYGYDDSTLAIGAVLEFGEDNAGKLSLQQQRRGGDGRIWAIIPIDLEPYKWSAELNVSEVEHDIQAFVSDVVTVTLAHISSELP